MNFVMFPEYILYLVIRMGFFFNSLPSNLIKYYLIEWRVKQMNIFTYWYYVGKIYLLK